MNSKGLLFLFGFIALFVIITSVIFNHYKKIEFTKEIYFEVATFETSSDLKSTVYDSEGVKLMLSSYIIYKHHNIQAGDVFRKDANSEELRVYRKDRLGLEKLILTLKPH